MGRLSAWSVWQQTGRLLIDNLGENLEVHSKAAFGSDDYIQTGKNMDDIQAQIAQHAVNGVRQVNQAIATANVVDRLRQAASDARRETDKIRNATATVARLTGMVDVLVQLVGGIGGVVKP